MKQHTTPCKTCPFRKDITPGALDGSPPQTYVGQSILPFWLPCHACYDPDKSAKDQDPATIAQCAGAAIYRANVGVAPLLPSALLRLPPDDKVFTAHETFLAHHAKVSVREAAEQLRRTPPDTLARQELARQEVKIHAVPTKTLLQQASEEAERLRDAGWLQADFANALKEELTSWDRQHRSRGHTSAPED